MTKCLYCHEELENQNFNNSGFSYASSKRMHRKCARAARLKAQREDRRARAARRAAYLAKKQELPA